MFGWRRRNEGFEWKEYVRTTVLVRRADRQKRIDDARMAALAKAKDVRDKGVAAGQASIETVATTARDVIKAVLSSLWRGIVASFATLGQIMVAIWRAFRDALPGRPALPRLSLPRPDVAKFVTPLRRPKREGPDGEPLRPDIPFRIPFRIIFSPQVIGGLAFLGLLVVVGGPMLKGDGDATLPSAPTASTANVETGALADHEAPPPAGNEISGRARAVGGDLLKIQGQIVKLASIEAPAAGQRCERKDGRSWNCSDTARIALRRMVRRTNVVCTTTGETVQGYLVGSCMAGDRDLAEELVRGGYVFANTGFFATYGSAEREARDNKIGIWQGGAVRPEDWRAQVWDDAKRESPDGCPIKGFARASEQTYMLPWSTMYSQMRVRESRGDRWFCSEDEARAAGFSLAASP